MMNLETIVKPLANAGLKVAGIGLGFALGGITAYGQEEDLSVLQGANEYRTTAGVNSDRGLEIYVPCARINIIGEGGVDLDGKMIEIRFSVNESNLDSGIEDYKILDGIKSGCRIDGLDANILSDGTVQDLRYISNNAALESDVNEDGSLIDNSKPVYNLDFSFNSSTEGLFKLNDASERDFSLNTAPSFNLDDLGDFAEYSNNVREVGSVPTFMEYDLPNSAFDMEGDLVTFEVREGNNVVGEGPQGGSVDVRLSQGIGVDRFKLYAVDENGGSSGPAPGTKREEVVEVEIEVPEPEPEPEKTPQEICEEAGNIWDPILEACFNS